jgi:hypothetical protein
MKRRNSKLKVIHVLCSSLWACGTAPSKTASSVFVSFYELYLLVSIVHNVNLAFMLVRDAAHEIQTSDLVSPSSIPPASEGLVELFNGASRLFQHNFAKLVVNATCC